MTASYQVRGSVAVITLDNPPVNGLGFATRQAVADGLARAEADAGGQGARAHRRRQGVLRRRRHPRVRLAEGHGRAEPADADQAGRRLRQAGGRGDPRRLHGRRAGTGAGLPLPRGGAGHQRGAARGQARPGPGRRRHAAPAARAGCRDGAEHDRQRRAGEERVAARPARAEAVRPPDRRRSRRRRHGLCSREGRRCARCRWCAT